jgi:hypothetical protein
MTMRTILPNNKKFCECGCKTLIHSRDNWNRPIRFKAGHNPVFPPSGSNHYAWIGGRILKTGYYKVKNKGHHRADKRGYVFEHVLVMEKYLGRKLGKDEDVQHKNGIKSDNRIKNLVVLTHGQHSTLHHSIRRNIIKKYKKLMGK